MKMTQARICKGCLFRAGEGVAIGVCDGQRLQDKREDSGVSCHGKKPEAAPRKQDIPGDRSGEHIVLSGVDPKVE